MNYETLRKNSPDWQAYVNHDFVRQLGDGSLAKASFQHYLKQDYLFLLQFSRAWALAVYKSDSLQQMRDGQAGLNGMLDTELDLHIAYCREWGMSSEEVQKTQESPACIAYTRYVLDCGVTGSVAEIYAALMPCIAGYAEIGKQLADKGVENNPYQSWIDTYASEDYQSIAIQRITMLDKLCQDISASQVDKIQNIFNAATRMEVAFWQMGLDLT